MEPGIVFGLIVALVAALMVVLVVWGIYYEKKRAEAWQRVAGELGLRYLGKQNDVLSRFPGFKIFQQGRSRRVTHAICGDSGDTEIILADYRYRTGSGKNSHTHNQTICILQSRDLQLPHCVLRPESMLFDFLGGLFGGKDFDFQDDPEFSGAYVLQGEDEAAVRRVFDASTRAWFAGRRGRGFHFETHRDTLMFHMGKRLKPDDTRPLMAQALEIKNLLATRGEAV